MSLDGTLAALAAVAAAVPAGLRWLRVSQREHYLPGSALRFAARWWRLLPWNPPAAALAVAGAVVAAVGEGRVRLAGALATAGVVAAGPAGLGVRGSSSPLAWTARLRRLAGVAAVPVAAGATAGAVGDLPWLAAATAVLVPAWVDAAAAVLAPLERRLGDRWVEQAAGRLSGSGARVVAITGSYGKTTTKAYLAHLLAGAARVVASPASFNNRMGLARAVNEQLTPGTEVFVAEMGTYGPGEIAELCRWVRPRVGVITALGPVHLERMGTEERIAEAKREILAGLAPGSGVGVVNVDHPLLRRIAEEEAERIRVVTCASAGPADVHADPLTGAVRVGGEEIGRFDPADAHAGNVAAAVAAAVALGFDPADLAGRLADLPTPPHRRAIAVSGRGVTVIDDTYNANPSGARAALAVLAALEAGRRVVVTPGMVELGARQEEANRAFAREAAEVADHLVVVGRTNRRALVEGAAAGGRASVIVRRTREEAVAWVRERLGPGDAVLYENDLPDHYP